MSNQLHSLHGHYIIPESFFVSRHNIFLKTVCPKYGIALYPMFPKMHDGNYFEITLLRIFCMLDIVIASSYIYK